MPTARRHPASRARRLLTAVAVAVPILLALATMALLAWRTGW